MEEDKNNNVAINHFVQSACLANSTAELFMCLPPVAANLSRQCVDITITHWPAVWLAG